MDRSFKTWSVEISEELSLKRQLKTILYLCTDSEAFRCALNEARRSTKNSLHNFILWCCELFGEWKISWEGTPDTGSKSMDLLEAFSVLFQDKHNCYIPRNKVNRYTQLLGVGVRGRLFFTFDGISSSKKYVDTREEVIKFLRNRFSNQIEQLALLEYMIGVGRGYYSGNLVRNDFVVVGLDNIHGGTNKPIFTFNQGRCIVCVVIVNEIFSVVGHFVRDQYDILLQKLMDILEGTKVERAKCYVISYSPEIDSKTLGDLIGHLCTDIEIYHHGKSRNIEDLYNYNIWVMPNESGTQVHYSESRTLDFYSKKLLRRYFESGVEMVRTSPYKKMEFKKWSKVSREDKQSA